jgi:UDP-glucuronate decarboxylase
MSLYPDKYLQIASQFLVKNSVDFAGAKILITGASGFVGTWVIDLLRYHTQASNQNVEIMALSRDLRATQLKMGIENFNYVKWLDGGVEKIKETAFEFTHALHAATPTTKETGALDDENVKFSSEVGLSYILELAKLNGNIPRILHTSSGAVYGPNIAGLEQIPLSNNLNEIKLDEKYNFFVYASAKRNTENALNSATQEGYVSGLNARLFSFYGPGLPIKSHFAIGNLIDQGIYAKNLTLNGRGQAVRSYMQGNVMAALILYAMWSDLKGATHIGSSDGRPLKFWANLVGEITNKEVLLLGNFDDSSDSYVPAIDKRLPHVNFSEEPKLLLSSWIDFVKTNSKSRRYL